MSEAEMNPIVACFALAIAITAVVVVTVLHYTKIENDMYRDRCSAQGRGTIFVQGKAFCFDRNTNQVFILS
jgi:hypothetical protein